MKEIGLTKGKVAFVDDWWYEYFIKWEWQFSGKYAVRSRRKSESDRPKNIYMHREILIPPPGMFVDHVDMNKLNNQEFNLRVCTQSQNSMNIDVERGSLSGFKGVERKDIHRWGSQIRFKGKRIGLGSYSSAEEAARVYDEKARELFGEFAKLNFPPK